jgi:hypothetical protein
MATNLKHLRSIIEPSTDFYQFQTLAAKRFAPPAHAANFLKTDQGIKYFLNNETFDSPTDKLQDDTVWRLRGPGSFVTTKISIQPHSCRSSAADEAREDDP